MKRLEALKLQHREIEEVLQKSLQELSDIKFALDVSTIVAITDQAGKIIFVNDKFCEISKYSREELIGQDHRIINSGYHSKDFIKDLWRTIASGKVWRGELRNRAKDGSFYWVDTTIVPFLNDKKKPYQYVAIRHEITQRKQMEEVLNELPQRIIQAQETERERISREIHDDLGQSLVTLKLLIQSHLPKENVNKINQRNYKRIVESLDVIIEKSRHLASSLLPSTLEVLGLTAAIKVMINDFKVKKDLKIRFKPADLKKFSFSGEEINLFRIIQEALTNVVKHAHASQADILMKVKDHTLHVIIKDNGRGFASDQIFQKSLGQSTMKERARLLGGQLSISSHPGRGTIVQLNIPITKNEN